MCCLGDLFSCENILLLVAIAAILLYVCGCGGDSGDSYCGCN